VMTLVMALSDSQKATRDILKIKTKESNINIIESRIFPVHIQIGFVISVLQKYLLNKYMLKL
jgi:hypothetical protein